MIDNIVFDKYGIPFNVEVVFEDHILLAVDNADRHYTTTHAAIGQTYEKQNVDVARKLTIGEVGGRQCTYLIKDDFDGIVGNTIRVVSIKSEHLNVNQAARFILNLNTQKYYPIMVYSKDTNMGEELTFDTGYSPKNVNFAYTFFCLLGVIFWGIGILVYLILMAKGNRKKVKVMLEIYSRVEAKMGAILALPKIDKNTETNTVRAS
jgi:hypothetical protein